MAELSNRQRIILADFYLEEAKIIHKYNRESDILDLLLENFDPMITEGIVQKGVDKIKSTKAYKSFSKTTLFELIKGVKALLSSVVEFISNTLGPKINALQKKLNTIRDKNCNVGDNIEQKQKMIFKVIGTSAGILSRLISALKLNTDIGKLLEQLKSDETSLAGKAWTVTKVAPLAAGALPGPNVAGYAVIPVVSLIEVGASYVSFFERNRELASKLDALSNAVNSLPDNVEYDKAEAVKKIVNNFKRIFDITFGQVRKVSTAADNTMNKNSVDEVKVASNSISQNSNNKPDRNTN